MYLDNFLLGAKSLLALSRIFLAVQAPLKQCYGILNQGLHKEHLHQAGVLTGAVGTYSHILWI
jgi:hypothetical protein